MENALMTEKEVAAFLNVPVAFLQKMRTRKMVDAGKCPVKFLRLGATIRYDPAVVRQVVVDGMAAAMSATEPSPHAAIKPEDDAGLKRGRGRPPGSKNKRKGD